MDIKIKDKGKKIGVSFNKLLKDHFKDHFKTARWNRFDVCWEINNNKLNKNKLKKWVEIVESSNVLDEIRELDEAKFTFEEIENLKIDLENLKVTLNRERRVYQEKIELNESKEKLLITLDEVKNELDELSKLTEKEKVRKSDLNNQLSDIFDKIVDVPKIDHAHSTMIRLRNKAISSFLYAKDKSEYNDAQERIDEERIKLHNAGWISIGLSDLSNMNCNRPDRDNPSSVTVDKLYDLRKIKKT